MGGNKKEQKKTKGIFVTLFYLICFGRYGRKGMAKT